MLILHSRWGTMMNNQLLPMISVIIPVYNVEKYLDRCLDSIVGQSYKNLQIILVDDGSTDESGYICDKRSTSDDRISVIHKKNGGLGEARNSGLLHAKGKYISFVDSDDYLRLDTYTQTVQMLESTNADICYFGCDYDVNGKIIVCETHYPDVVYDKAEINKILIPLSFGTSIERKKDEFGIGSVCCGVYKRNLFEKNNLKFESEREVLCEDILFTSKLLICANRVCFLGENNYIYYRNQTSLTHTFRTDRFEKSIGFYRMQIALIEKYHLGQDARVRACYSLLINLIVCIRQEAKTNKIPYCDKVRRIKETLDDKNVTEALQSLDTRKFNTKKRILLLLMKCKISKLVLLIGRG